MHRGRDGPRWAARRSFILLPAPLTFVPATLITGIANMYSITGLPDSDWSMPSDRTSAATSNVGTRRHPSRTSSEHVSSLARVQRRVAGQAIALAGSFNILLGTVLADQHRTACGHRQRVVGMLQLNCEVDRQTADAFVDRWLPKRAMPQEA